MRWLNLPYPVATFQFSPTFSLTQHIATPDFDPQDTQVGFMLCIVAFPSRNLARLAAYISVRELSPGR